jgi:hypothetical protein
MGQKQLSSGQKGVQTPQIQWQPTLTVHDPNPPLTLESPAGGVTHDGAVTFSIALASSAAGQRVVEAQVASTIATTAAFAAERIAEGAVAESLIMTASFSGELILHAAVEAGITLAGSFAGQRIVEAAMPSVQVELTAAFAGEVASTAKAGGGGWTPEEWAAFQRRIEDEERRRKERMRLAWRLPKVRDLDAERSAVRRRRNRSRAVVLVSLLEERR